MKTEKKIGIALSVFSLTSGILVEHYITAPPFMYAVTTFVWLGACIGAALYLIP